MGRTRLPEHIRAMIPAAERSAPKPKATKRQIDQSVKPKRQRPAHWPDGIGSELEFMLINRLERTGLPAPLPQYRVIPGRDFRFDLCWPAQRVAVEVQGGIWVNGAHSRGSGVERDCTKYCLAAAAGWRVLPVTKSMIESGEAVRLIAQALGFRRSDAARKGE